MQVQLKFCTPDPEAHIGEAAAECYDSSTEREACLRRTYTQARERQHLVEDLIKENREAPW